MLHRVSGKLVDGSPFAARIEAPNSVGAFVTGRKALNDAGKPDEDIAEIRVRPIVGKSAVTFGKVKTAEEIAKAKADRKARGNKPAASGKAATPAAAKR